MFFHHPPLRFHLFVATLSIMFAMWFVVQGKVARVIRARLNPFGKKLFNFMLCSLGFLFFLPQPPASPCICCNALRYACNGVC